jgi:hypothetical protein
MSEQQLFHRTYPRHPNLLRFVQSQRKPVLLSHAHGERSYAQSAVGEKEREAMRTERKLISIVLLVIMISAMYTAVVSTAGVQAMDNYKIQLENVRDYTPGWSAAHAVGHQSYAIDGGYLYTGGPNQWREVSLPADVIAGAVAVDPYQPTTLYVGAANELALYLSRDSGDSWQHILLDKKYIGGITDIAVNGAQRTLYLATDTAGIFRLRDVGSSIILSGHTMMQEPVLEVVADQLGAGLIFARTQWTVYQGVNNGQQWLPLDGLQTTPTALAVANSRPATAYIGTTDRGLLQSNDGVRWHVVPALRPTEAGSRLQVSAVAVDPIQPHVVYVALNYLFGSTTVHQTPVGVAMTVDSGTEWAMISAENDAAVVELLPVAGTTGAVFALTTTSRTPLALGTATDLVAATEIAPVRAMATAAAQPVWTISLLSWLIAASAAAALAWLLLQEWQQPLLSTAQLSSHAR